MLYDVHETTIPPSSSHSALSPEFEPKRRKRKTELFSGMIRIPGTSYYSPDTTKTEILQQSLRSIVPDDQRPKPFKMSPIRILRLAVVCFLCRIHGSGSPRGLVLLARQSNQLTAASGSASLSKTSGIFPTFRRVKLIFIFYRRKRTTSKYSCQRDIRKSQQVSPLSTTHTGGTVLRGKYIQSIPVDMRF